MRGVRAAAGAIAVAAGLGLGCAGDDGGATTAAPARLLGELGENAAGKPRPPLLRGDYVLRADDLCAAAEREIDARRDVLLERLSSGGRPSNRALARLADEVVVPGLEREIEGLIALPPPDRDRDPVAYVLAAGESAQAAIQDDPELLRREQGAEAFAEADRLAAEYGYEDCIGY